MNLQKDRLIIQPQSKGTFENELIECLERLISECKDNQGLLQLNFFLKVADNHDYVEKSEVVRTEVKRFISVKPALACIAQAPTTGTHLAIEVLLSNNQINPVYKSIEDVSYTVLEHKGYKEVFAAGISGLQVFESIESQTEKAFSILNRILQNEGLGFGNIVRQWNYVENILRVDHLDAEEIQNYQVLNNVRTKYYDKSEFPDGYPAATGIGMNAGGIILEMHAISDSTELMIRPVQNPMQTDAYNYSERVLVGSRKTTPKFERAKFVGNGVERFVYISGTAAIHNELTLAEGDLTEQTKITIDNIHGLISDDNLQIVLKTQNVMVKPCYLRIYVKANQPYSAVESYIKERYPNVDYLILVADICRDNLLVEIEGIATG